MKFREIKTEKQPKLRKLTREEEEKIIRYWLVEITLTSGEGLQYYVSGKTQFDAQEKADSYTYWVGNEKLINKLRQFRLFP